MNYFNYKLIILLLFFSSCGNLQFKTKVPEVKKNNNARLKRYYKKGGKEKQRQWLKKNRERRNASVRKWRQLNREKVAAIQRKAARKRRLSGKTGFYKRNRYQNDQKYRLMRNLRTRLCGAFRAQGVRKTTSTMKLCGCSLEKLKQHLESQFTEGMTWDNKGDWHVDHIKPCASFDLTDPEEQKKCFHYTNLQPLWALDNMRKGAKY